MTGQYEAWEGVPGVKLTSPSPGPLGRTRAFLVPLHGLKQGISLLTSSPHLPPFPGEPLPLCIHWNLMPADGPGGAPSPCAPPARPTSLSITYCSVRPRHWLSRCPAGLHPVCPHSLLCSFREHLPNVHPELRHGLAVRDAGEEDTGEEDVFSEQVLWRSSYR